MITGQVRDLAVAILRDATSGFNALIAANAPLYTGAAAYSIDFSDTSRQFFESQIDPDAIEMSSPLKYPAACLYGLSSENQNIEKFRLFSGPIAMGLDIYLSWRTSGVTRNTEALASLTEHVVALLFNGAAAEPYFTGDVTWNGGLRCQRGRIETGAEHWRQHLAFTLTFELNT